LRGTFAIRTDEQGRVVAALVFPTADPVETADASPRVMIGTT
jgi:hypothetical protein